MAITTRLPNETREIPHELGNHFTFRVLSAKQLDESRRVAQEKQAAAARSFSGIEIPGGNDDVIAAARAKAAADPLTPHDVVTLVACGVVSWNGPNYDGVECDGAAKDELDQPTRDWAARTLIGISEISEGEAGGSGNSSAPQLAVVSESRSLS